MSHRYVEFKRNLKAIRIAGKGPSWSSEPNVWGREEPDDVEVWGVGTIYRTHRAIDRLFIMHDIRQDIIFEDRDLVENLREYGAPVYSNDTYGGVCKLFPTNMVMDNVPRHYFSNTVSWMLALAVTLKPEVISLHGIDYLDSFQYVAEKACVEYWLGYAEAMGIRVELQDRSNLLTTDSVYGPLYGFVPLRKRNGLITDFMPEFLDGTRPQILKAYRLVPANQ